MLKLKLQYFGPLVLRTDIGKDPDAGKDWRQEEKGTTENDMVGCHHWLDGHEFEQDLGVGDGQRNLACCSPWGHKESDTTDWLNWTDPLQLEKKWQPNSVFLPGKSHGRRSLAGHSPWGCRESGMTSRWSTHTHTPSVVYSSNFSHVLSDVWPLPPHHDLVGMTSLASPSRQSLYPESHGDCKTHIIWFSSLRIIVAAYEPIS